jgi:hypothetical protein
MEKLTINVFKHFRFFLKKNKQYDLFMRNFRRQPIQVYHVFDSKIPNYIQIMMKDSVDGCGKEYFNEFGAMHLIFRSFNWSGDYSTNKTSSKHWATVGLKWALYCIRHNIDICTDERLGRLIEYWDSNGFSESWDEYQILGFTILREYNKEVCYRHVDQRLKTEPRFLFD